MIPGIYTGSRVMIPGIYIGSISLLSCMLTLIALKILGIDKWMKKRYRIKFADYSFRVSIILLASSLGLFSLQYLIPYFENYEIEHDYGIEQVYIQKDLNKSDVYATLDLIPSWLVYGTKQVTFTNQPLGYYYIIIDKGGTMCVAGSVSGTYDHENDAVEIQLNSNEDIKEMIWHEFNHRFWYRFMTVEEVSEFQDLHDFNCTENIVFMEGDAAKGNNYYIDCIRMDTIDEEFAYKFTWFILDKEHEKLSDKEILYFTGIVDKYKIAKVSDTYKMRDAMALIRSLLATKEISLVVSNKTNAGCVN